MPKTREDSVRDCCLKKRGRDEETPWDTIKARESRTFFILWETTGCEIPVNVRW